MSELIWVHEDALRLEHPVFNGADDVPRLFVFDDELLKAREYSLKRLMFITETLIEMGMPVYRGNAVDVVTAVARDKGLTRIAVADTPDPELQQRIHALREMFEVTVVQDVPFVPEIEGEFFRFFKFWNKIKKPLMQE